MLLRCAEETFTPRKEEVDAAVEAADRVCGEMWIWFDLCHERCGTEVFEALIPVCELDQLEEMLGHKALQGDYFRGMSDAEKIRALKTWRVAPWLERWLGPDTGRILSAVRLHCMAFSSSVLPAR